MTGRSDPGTRGQAARLCAPMIVVALSFGTAADAEVPTPPKRASHNLFGVTGLIDTPTAEMQPDAQFSLTASHFGGFTRNTVSFQIFPFLEGAFRYSVLQDFNDPAVVRPTLFDRSFDVKLRLVEESKLFPAVAVGLQDFLGTGVYSGEYVVATKSFLDGDITVTGGIGWGRFSTLNGITNPVGELIEGARERGGSVSGGGQVNFGNYFQGEDAGLFGGIAWRTPVDGLTLKVEYSNDDYAREDDFSDFRQTIPVNFGLEYRPFDWAEIGAYYMYGREFGVRLTITGNVFDPAFDTETETAPVPITARPVPAASRRAAEAELGEVVEMIGDARVTRFFADAPVSDVEVEERIGGVRWAVARLSPAADSACPIDLAPVIDAEEGLLDAVSFEDAGGRAVCTVALRQAGAAAIRLTRRATLDYPTDWHGDPAARDAIRTTLAATLDETGLGLIALELTPSSARLHLENTRFNQMPRAIGRAARAMAHTLPPSVERFEIVPVEDGLPVVSVALSRAVLEDTVNRPDAAHLAWSTARLRDAAPLAGAAAEMAGARYPSVSWALDPVVPVSLFDPDEPVRADLQVAATGQIALAPGASFTTTVSKRVVGNLDSIVRESDSVLPRVRSEFARYLDEGDPAITRMTADYVTKLTPSVYARASGGLLERMFAGVQGEVLWRPVEQSWGVGAELAYVRQRDFNTLFDLQDYDVVTGHVSLYWDTPYQGVAMQLDAGRYLAGDYGGTFTLKRRFTNGWEIGGFATFTDVSFDDFGEGSFDKGLFLTIPLNWSLPYESRSRLATVLRPLSRDGGQRLTIANRLYPLVEDHGAAGLSRRSGGFWE